jgi:hypothetical protein
MIYLMTQDTKTDILSNKDKQTSETGRRRIGRVLQEAVRERERGTRATEKIERIRVGEY